MYAKSEQYAYTLTYPNAGQAHPHAATSATSSNGGPTFNMTYDANGNMTVENSDTFTYNGDNQLIKHVISGGATITYVYDGQGNLVKKSSTDGTSTIYIGSIYEKHQDGSYITYYNAFGRRIAMRKHTGPGDTTGTVYFFLADTLGSTSTILSSAGTVVESEKYYPYGGLRSGGITTTDKQFTGQQNEGTAFGLYDYGARFYSTVTGQFLSPDPKVQSTYDPLCWDRYAYAQDNPLRYVDPTGLDASDLHRLADALNAAGISGGDFESAMRGRENGRGGASMTKATSPTSPAAWTDEQEVQILTFMHHLADEGWTATLFADAYMTQQNIEQEAEQGIVCTACQYSLNGIYAAVAARTMIGAGYQLGTAGEQPNGAYLFDCAGLVHWSYAQVGVKVAWHAQTFYGEAQRFDDPRQLQPGDLVFYQHTYDEPNGDVITHVAIYEGDGKIVVADQAGGVHEDTLYYDLDHFAGYGRPGYE